MTADALYLEAALGHYHAGEFADAIGVCRHAFARFPDAGRLWEVCGLSHWMLRRFPDALAALETASALVPLLPLPQLALASLYAWADKPDLARTVYAHLTALPEFPIPLLPKLAAGLGRVGDDEAALEVCEKIVALRPCYHPAWFGVAFYRLRLRRPAADAIPALKRAHALAPAARTYRLNLAACLGQAGRCGEAFDAIADIPVDEIRCPHWLRLLRPVYAAVGDAGREAACARLLSSLGDGPAPDDWNPDGPCHCT